MIKKRRVVIIGCGFVGTSVAYSLLNQGVIEELGLIDINTSKAEGERMDLLHGISYYPKGIKVTCGGYEQCKEADIVILTAGTSQSEINTSRLDSVEKDTKIVKEITLNVVNSGFDGIFVVASNPVDIMTYVINKVSNFPKNRIIGTGTLLDTSRLKYFVGEYLNIAPQNVHAYVLGEHGDSSFVVWSRAYVGAEKIVNIFKKSNSLEDLDNIYEKVKNAGYEVISRKKATYYAIGMVTAKIVDSIYNDENNILPVSTYLDGEYSNSDICIGVPCIVNSNGIDKIVELKLNEEEQEKFNNSVNILKNVINERVTKIL